MPKEIKPVKPSIIVSASEVSDHYLMLNPLSSITDEDAIEVAKRLYPLCFAGKCKSNWEVKNDHLDTDEYIVIEHKDNSYNFSICVNPWSATVYNGNEFENVVEHIHAIDFLRSRGYALPWMGLSVEEMENAGWIKLIN